MNPISEASKKDRQDTTPNKIELYRPFALAISDECQTPHEARYYVGKRVMEKTGNVAAVQRALGHRNATYAMQYPWFTKRDILDAID